MNKKIKTLVLATAISIMSVTPVFAHGTYTEENKISQDIYNHMENRDNVFKITYSGDVNKFLSNFNEIVKGGYMSDDYLSLSWKNINPTAKLVSGNVEVTLNVSYISTKEEENYSDKVLLEVANHIKESNSSDYDMIKAINKYIVDNYSYDDSLESRSVYQALTTSKAVCQNYAMTAYRLLNNVGIENRIVVGSTPFGSHSWNIVKIDGNWYNLDTTNNDSLSSEKYLLVSDKVLKDNGYVWDETAYPSATTTYEVKNNIQDNIIEEVNSEKDNIDEVNSDVEIKETIKVNSKESIDEAINWVGKAEITKTDYYINKAYDSINGLYESNEKLELTNRMKSLELKKLNEMKKSAENSVIYAEKYKTQSFIILAEKAVEILPEDEYKTSLVNRINSLKAPVIKTETSNTENSSAKKLEEGKVNVINSYLDFAKKYGKKIYLNQAINLMKDIKVESNINELQLKIDEISKLDLK